MAEAQGLAFSAAASALARAFWPGRLSLVLPGGSGRLPDLLRGPEGGIAVRWTSHRGMARLVQALGEPVTSTSANLPGQPPAPGAAAITRDFAAAVAAGTLLVLDGGVLGNSPPSTVVDCTQPAPRLVREGALTLAELRRAVGRLPRLLTRELVEEVDLILTMARHHRARVDELGGESHVFVLGEYAGREGDAAEVSDPFGGDLEVYRDTCVELEALIDTAVERIVKEFASGGNQR